MGTHLQSLKSNLQTRETQSLFAMPLAIDLLNPSLDVEKAKHKKKRLVQSPNSFFMDVKCTGCFKIKTIFSHAQTVVICPGCNTICPLLQEVRLSLLPVAASERRPTPTTNNCLFSGKKIKKNQNFCFFKKKKKKKKKKS